MIDVDGVVIRFDPNTLPKANDATKNLAIKVLSNERRFSRTIVMQLSSTSLDCNKDANYGIQLLQVAVSLMT